MLEECILRRFEATLRATERGVCVWSRSISESESEDILEHAYITWDAAGCE